MSKIFFAKLLLVCWIITVVWSIWYTLSEDIKDHRARQHNAQEVVSCE